MFEDEMFRDEVDAIVNRLATAAPIGLKTLKANFVDSERMDFAGYVAARERATPAHVHLQRHAGGLRSRSRADRRSSKDAELLGLLEHGEDLEAVSSRRAP
jgi:hypothetical protein